MILLHLRHHLLSESQNIEYLHCSNPLGLQKELAVRYFHLVQYQTAAECCPLNEEVC